MKISKSNRRIRKMNNKGAALVTVIIVIALISILATTALFVSGLNFKMKQTDYQGKQNFYSAEKTLDKIKAAAIEDVSEASDYAYKETMAEMGNYSAAQLQIIFRDKYIKYISETIWKTRITAASGSHYQAFWDFANTNVPEANLGAATPTTIILPDETTDVDGDGVISSLIIDDTTSPDRVVIRNVRIMETSGDYTSYIMTDIAYTVPEYNWDIRSGASEPRKHISMADYCVYMNWRKY